MKNTSSFPSAISSEFSCKSAHEDENTSLHRSCEKLSMRVLQGVENPTVGDMLRETALILLIGLAGLVALCIITFLITVIMDRCMGRPATSATTQNSGADRISPAAIAQAAAAAAANRDAGTLSRKARLWGLETEERELILRAFFQQHCKTYSVRPVTSQGVLHQQEKLGNVHESDIEMGPLESSNEPSRSSHSDESVPVIVPAKVSSISDAKRNNESNENVTRGTDETTTATNEMDPMASLDAHDFESMCSICLLPYEPGISKVMSGTQCNHLFHFDCCQAWLMEHDHCPYCRQDMLQPVEFRQAAVRALGEERVNVLTRHSQATASPVASNLLTAVSAPPS